MPNIKYHLTLVRMVIIKKSTKQVNIGEVCGEIKCLHASGENANWHTNYVPN